LAKALAHDLDAGWLQLDSIWLAMKVAAAEGTPARDVLDIDRRMRREDEADGDVLAAHVAASGEACRALPTVLCLELEAHERLVVDGAWLLPSFVTELELPDTEVCAVYVVQRTEADVEAALIPRRGGLPTRRRSQSQWTQQHCQVRFTSSVGSPASRHALISLACCLSVRCLAIPRRTSPAPAHPPGG
jgi:hypothetical protein